MTSRKKAPQAGKSTKRRQKKSFQSNDLGDNSWIKRELQNQGKTQTELATYLRNRGFTGHTTDSRVSKLIKGMMPIRAPELEAIRSFLGLTGGAVSASNIGSAGDNVRVIGIAAEGIFVDPMSNRQARTSHRQIASPETKKYGGKRYALELEEPLDPSPRVETEFVVCLPMKYAKRDLEIGDLVHMKIEANGLEKTLVRRVQKARDGTLEFAPATASGVGEILRNEDCVKGVVLARNIVMKG